MRSKGVQMSLIGAATLLFMVASIFGAIWVTHTQSAELGHARLKCQSGVQATHRVTIINNHLQPSLTQAKVCDTLIITNLDTTERLIAFGQHNNHISYDGISEKLLPQNDSLQVTLVRPGNYVFHDHDHDEVRGSFTVR